MLILNCAWYKSISHPHESAKTYIRITWRCGESNINIAICVKRECKRSPCGYFNGSSIDFLSYWSESFGYQWKKLRVPAHDLLLTGSNRTDNNFSNFVKMYRCIAVFRYPVELAGSVTLFSALSTVLPAAILRIAPIAFPALSLNSVVSRLILAVRTFAFLLAFSHGPLPP